MQMIIERIAGNRLEARTDTASVVVDRPAAERGESDAFRSGELLLASLGTCMLGTMLSFAEREGIAVDNVRVELKPLVALNPERISKIRMTMFIGGDLTDIELEQLRDAAEGCKIHNTLHAGARTELTVKPAAVTG